MVTQRARSLISVAGVLALLITLPWCAAEEVRPRVDERLLAALGLAQSYQHQADELVDIGQRDQAIQKVRQVLEIPFPEGVPEREDVRLDAHGRLGELHLDDGDETAATASIDRGLAESTRNSYFKARLFSVRGRVLRARAARLRDAGEEEASREASRQAIEAFEQSIEINRHVLGMEHDAGAVPGEGASNDGNS